MWKFLLGVAVGIILVIVGGLILLFAIGRILQARQPSIAQNSALVLAFSGDIPESSPVEIPIPFIESQANPTIRDVWTSLRKAATDSRIKAVVIKPHGLVIGWAKLEELHHDILDFKRSGKPVYAYLQSPGSREYYLASAADKIFLSPDDSLDVKGFLLEEMYLKDTLDKLGIQVQVDHIGRFKDAGDVFTKTGMSPETREVLNQLLDQIYGDFCATVGAGRHKSSDEIKGLVNEGPFLATEAKAAGLIDELGYEDEVYSDLKKRTGSRNLNRITLKTYYHAVPGQGDRIALLVGEGEITEGEGGGPFGNDNLIQSGAFARLIQRVRQDSSIKGVILRIDSPGGDAVASDEILHELKLLSHAKPLIVSMSDLAASGGYFMSMTGDSLVAYPDTITGSIGVLYLKPNVRGLYDKLGIKEDILTRGKLADMESESLPLSDAAQQKLHESIEATYRAFVSKVATARRKSFDQIDQLAQGRVWMGAQARQNGLVDQIGGLDEAVELIRRKAHLTATGETNLVLYPPKRSLIEILTESTPSAFEEEAIEARIRSYVPALPSRALLKGGVQELLPYRFVIH